MKVLKIARLIALVLAGVTVFAAVLGLAVMWLWNWLMPGLFGLPHLTYLQAVGLLVLSHLLFRGHALGRSHDTTHRSPSERRAAFARRIRHHLGGEDDGTTTMDEDGPVSTPSTSRAD